MESETLPVEDDDDDDNNNDDDNDDEEDVVQPCIKLEISISSGIFADNSAKSSNEAFKLLIDKEDMMI